MNKQRDLLVLKFLWEFKVATTAMLYERFFSDVKHRTAYNCLLRLKKQKLIGIRTTQNGICPVWELTKMGLKEVVNLIPPLSSKVTSSENHVHDLLVTSIHLGPFIKGAPKDLEFISEQKLRSVDNSLLPHYVFSPKEHRPDGYWYIQDSKKLRLMALEVELHQKAKKLYEEVSFFYSDFKESDRCIWIVKKQSVARTILRSMYKTRPDYYIHNFLLLKDILKLGWNAPIIIGPDKFDTLYSLFDQSLQSNDRPSPDHMFIKYLLDNRLSYENHSVLEMKELFSRVNCIGVSL